MKIRNIFQPILYSNILQRPESKYFVYSLKKDILKENSFLKYFISCKIKSILDEWYDYMSIHWYYYVQSNPYKSDSQQCYFLFFSFIHYFFIFLVTISWIFNISSFFIFIFILLRQNIFHIKISNFMSMQSLLSSRITTNLFVHFCIFICLMIESQKIRQSKQENFIMIKVCYFWHPKYFMKLFIKFQLTMS